MRPTMRTRDRVAREDRVRVNRTATMGGIRWREVNLLGGFVNRGLSEGCSLYKLGNYFVVLS